MEDKLKKIIEMMRVLTEMETDTYMQYKYILLSVSKRRNSLNHFIKMLFGLTDNHRPPLIEMKKGGAA